MALCFGVCHAANDFANRSSAKVFVSRRNVDGHTNLITVKNKKFKWSANQNGNRRVVTSERWCHVSVHVQSNIVPSLQFVHFDQLRKTCDRVAQNRQKFQNSLQKRNKLSKPIERNTIDCYIFAHDTES